MKLIGANNDKEVLNFNIVYYDDYLVRDGLTNDKNIMELGEKDYILKFDKINTEKNFLF